MTLVKNNEDTRKITSIIFLVARWGGVRVGKTNLRDIE